MTTMQFCIVGKVVSDFNSWQFAASSMLQLRNYSTGFYNNRNIYFKQIISYKKQFISKKEIKLYLL